MFFSLGFPLYLTGYTLFTVITNGSTSLCNTNVSVSQVEILDEKCAYSILPTLIIIAIGASAVRCNLVAFGADQVQYSKTTSLYFEKYLVATNLAMIIYTFNVALDTDPEKYWFILYQISNSMLIVSAFLFIIGWKFYIHVKPYSSVITSCIPVCRNAFQTWSLRRADREHQTTRRYTNNTSVRGLVAIDDHAMEESEESGNEIRRPSAFLDNAKIINHGKFQDGIVEDVKSFRSAIILFFLILPSKLIYHQV